VVNGSSFQIEQQCPQCGAPIILDEADRILSCQFCRTRVYLATDDHFRFYMSPGAGVPNDIFFIPYWRLRGLSYTLRGKNVTYKYFDSNFLCYDFPELPYSLGLRPQALKLKFVGSDNKAGKFITASSATAKTFSDNFQQRAKDSYRREILIGETASMIYTPVYSANGRLYDAILKKPLTPRTDDGEIEERLDAAPSEQWHVAFVPLLCPHCGADLPGEKDTLIVFCSNCHSAWNPSDKFFSRVNFFTWRETGDNIIYLPFWQMKLRVNGLRLESYADLIRVANLPKAPAEIWTRTPFYFYAPAFKINPALFLRWCRQLTATPPETDLTVDFPVQNVYPVTLPLSEALESALITLSSLMTERQLLEVSSSLEFTPEDCSLVLHPFTFGGKELVHTKLGFSMDMAALNLGGYL
jgi:uncharacterized CHY-type Zn-finger protein